MVKRIVCRIRFRLHGTWQLCLDGRSLLTISKNAELDEDDYVFNDGAQGADQPWQICEKVVLLQRMEQDTGAVSSVAQQR